MMGAIRHMPPVLKALMRINTMQSVPIFLSAFFSCFPLALLASLVLLDQLLWITKVYSTCLIQLYHSIEIVKIHVAADVTESHQHLTI